MSLYSRKDFIEASKMRDELTKKLNKANYDNFSKTIDIETCNAKFESDSIISTGFDKYTFDNLVINTGSIPFIPNIEGIDNTNAPIHTSQSIFKLKSRPDTMLILGTGYIGIEFANIFSNYGTKVTMLQNTSDFMPNDEKEFSEFIEAELNSQGVEIKKNFETNKIEYVNGKIKIEDNIADVLLVATGRKPNVYDLGLENTNIKYSQNGIEVDEHNRTSVNNIYAVGDVIGKEQFTYISYDDYKIVYSSIYGDSSYTRNSRKNVPYCLFTDTVYSKIGLTQDQLKGKNTITRKLVIDKIPGAKAIGKTKGFMKAVIDKDTEQILSFAMLGANANEVVNIIKVVMDNMISYKYLKDMIITHPSISEGLNELFDI